MTSIMILSLAPPLCRYSAMDSARALIESPLTTVSVMEEQTRGTYLAGIARTKHRFDL